MDKGLQEVIAKLNLQKNQNSQTLPIQHKPVENIPIKAQEEGLDEEIDDIEADEPTHSNNGSEKATTELKDNEMEIELLNNNGRFRAEMLFQLQELNKTLVVITQVLMQSGRR